MQERHIQRNRELVDETKWNKTLTFTYRNRDGEYSQKEIEVYDWRNDVMFFGWDLAENKTKQFDISRMTHAKIGNPFVSRFERKK